MIRFVEHFAQGQFRLSAEKDFFQQSHDETLMGVQPLKDHFCILKRAFA